MSLTVAELMQAADCTREVLAQDARSVTQIVQLVRVGGREFILETGDGQEIMAWFDPDDSQYDEMVEAFNAHVDAMWGS